MNRQVSKPNISADRLRGLFRYDQETGWFIWLTPPTNRVRIGDRAGSVRASTGKLGLAGGITSNIALHGFM
jgi:hypothetical protein